MSAIRSRKRRLAAAVIILSTCIGCEQVTKSMATHSLRDIPPQGYLNGTIRIEYALNPGGFLSLGSNLPGEFRRGYSSASIHVFCWLSVSFSSLGGSYRSPCLWR